MKNFVAFFDNLVTDDPVFKKIKADTIEEADQIAWKTSRDDPTLSEGNYDLYIDICHLSMHRFTSLEYGNHLNTEAENK